MSFRRKTYRRVFCQELLLGIPSISYINLFSDSSRPYSRYCSRNLPKDSTCFLQSFQLKSSRISSWFIFVGIPYLFLRIFMQSSDNSERIHPEIPSKFVFSKKTRIRKKFFEECLQKLIHYIDTSKISSWKCKFFFLLNLSVFCWSVFFIVFNVFQNQTNECRETSKTMNFIGSSTEIS